MTPLSPLRMQGVFYYTFFNKFFTKGVVMKTNLDKLYATNTEKESDGFWYPIADGIEWKLRRFGGKNTKRMKEISAEVLKPYLKQIQKKTISDERMDALTVESFVKACVVDWKGMVIDEKEVKFSVDQAIAVLQALPELREELMTEANSVDNFKVELGN